MSRSHPGEPNGSTSTSEETPLLHQATPAPKTPPTVSWASMPRKSQLAVIVFARLAEPLSERSLTSYLFYQLKWFNPDLDAGTIAKQAGYLTAMFAAAQCLTSMWWGHLADDPRLGRKRVLVIGLVGSAVSALGMGFSRSLYLAFFFRFLAGALNGNVGVLRTMISEVIADKRYQSRAFLLLPMCFNVGVIIGPLLSSFLADPVHSLPGLFGDDSLFGGANGVQWMKHFPYALPNLFFAILLSTAALGVILGLDETHPHLRYQTDPGRKLGKVIMRKIFKHESPLDSGEIAHSSASSGLLENDIEATPMRKPEVKQRPSIRGVLTKRVCYTMLQRFLQSLHVSAFNSILFNFLPTPRADAKDFRLPFRFSGGLGLSAQKMGLANTTIGMVGIPLQLLLYPRLISSLGVRNSYRVFLPLGAVAYCLLPYLVLLSDDAAIIWTCLSVVLTLQVLSRTFVNPATVMLVNDCAPSPNALGTVHGFAQSISSAARIMGPVVGGNLLGWGLGHNFVGLPLWVLAIVSMANLAVVWKIEDVHIE
ncbi:related to permease of the major facilitator superfamily [Cephalotrichum gorgonifer]|uniref:Related to permease of the major facilitator superfamily n=1 Tax=Cephalotrichum gorgonifer TaxID=2041049 RepID=A0AAE8MYJ9_9PEZI|nr:related to permease of the major facilitator superfamily [Cephalotrichum gorgonifer]